MPSFTATTELANRPASRALAAFFCEPSAKRSTSSRENSSSVAIRSAPIPCGINAVLIAVSGADPTIMLTGPAPAARKALEKAGLTADDLDLVEINEAFAAVVLRFVRDMGLDMEKVNVNGGSIAMGHPLGATGGMILGTLIDELHRTGGKYGLATLCVGGGMGIATVVEAI